MNDFSLNKRIRIEGIYDFKTLSILKEEEIEDFGFDFRPKSFNFLQQHCFMDMIRNFYDLKCKYYFHFSNESSCVIQKITTDLRKGLSLDQKQWQSFYLEFSGQEKPEEMISYKMPFLWHYRPRENASEILRSHLLKGIVLNYDFIQNIHESQRIYSFLQTFLHSTATFFSKNEGELFLRRNWSSDIFPSLYELFDFSVISLPINNHIERAYRHVDIEKMKQQLEPLRREF